MDREAIEQLLKKYVSGTCTPEEKVWVEQWYQKLDTLRAEDSADHVEADIADVRRRLPVQARRIHIQAYRYAASIAATLVLAAGLFFYQSRPASGVDATTQAAVPSIVDIAPGGNRAVLQLADGTEITLDDRPTGQVAEDGSNTIYKNDAGDLVYRLADSGDDYSGTPVFNTMRTPRGGQYHLVLPDGTRVWLNAASSLTYAVNGSQGDRLVKLDGEAYFEVIKDVNRPFRVESRGQIVEVLGTQFNVNSYADEPHVKTTLVEGRVNVVATANGQSVTLQPRQETTLHDGMFAVRPVDVADATAWKNGKFSFNNSDIGTVMRQLSRWYDVDVVFLGKMPHVALSGEVYRNTHASNVLSILSFYQLDVRIENVDGTKRIVVQ